MTKTSIVEEAGQKVATTGTIKLKKKAGRCGWSSQRPWRRTFSWPQGSSGKTFDDSGRGNRLTQAVFSWGRELLTEPTHPLWRRHRSLTTASYSDPVDPVLRGYEVLAPSCPVQVRQSQNCDCVLSTKSNMFCECLMMWFCWVHLTVLLLHKVLLWMQSLSTLLYSKYLNTC